MHLRCHFSDLNEVSVTRYLQFAQITMLAVTGCARADSTVIVNGHQVTVTGNNSYVEVNGTVYRDTGGVTEEAKGPIAMETRSLDKFTAVSLNIPANVTYRIEPTPRVTVTAQADILAKIRTAVEGKVLVIGVSGPIVTSKPIQLDIEGPNLTGIGVTGAGQFSASRLRGKAVTFDVSGAGHIMADGVVERADVDVSGAGQVDLTDLRTKEIRIDASGAGRVQAHATEIADVNVSGAADVRVAGNPARRHVDRTGAASVKFE
ncbi:Putative auto-transporter adhesin, head GIN domain [Cupriavidus sp. YR651]|nr:Putative auto-transporter adhesin, head GIN domain [Cupriavidus sp. YR651]